MMNKIIYFRIVLIAILTLIFQTNANANWGASYDKAATVTAHIEPTGGGKVYVAVEATSFSNPRTSDWKTTTSVGGNSSTTRGASLPVFIYAQANNGYEFLGWSGSSTGTIFTSSDYADSYTNGNTHGIKKNYTAYSGNGDGEEPYDIYARFSPLPYDITYRPGDRGAGTSSTQNVTIRTDITLQSGTIFTQEIGYEFKEWKVTELGSTKEKWALDQTFNSSNLHIRTGYYSENVTLTAQWQVKPYSISYVVGTGGSLKGGTSQQSYNIADATTLRYASKTGNTFYGWKVTSIADPAECNWSVGDIIPYTGSSPVVPAGKYGDITLTAQWDPLPCDIIISVTGLNDGENAIFNVSKNGSVLFTVAVSAASPSVTIKSQEVGDYTVTPARWNWAYTTTPVSSTKTISYPSTEFSFAAAPVSNPKKHDEKSNVNWKP